MGPIPPPYREGERAEGSRGRPREVTWGLGFSDSPSYLTSLERVKVAL